MDDAFLIQQTLSGQLDAFRLLVLRHQRGLFRFLGLLGFGPAVAEELAQEAFLRAYRHLAEFDPGRARFTTWLYTMARNLAVNESGRLRHRFETGGENLETYSDGAPDPLQMAVSHEQHSRLRQALAGLPEVLRSALVLAQVEGLPLEDVASVQGCAIGTVKSRVFRAREILRAALKEDG
jgi:RNA polymerase sigma-70 factor (ECF subfamily)